MNNKFYKIICFLLSFIMAFNFVFSSLNISYAEDTEESEDYTSSFDDSGDKVDYLQRAITYLFVFGVADQLKTLISIMFGKVTIDSLLFNNYPDTRLAFYKDSQGYGQNKFLSSGLLDMINKYFLAFRKIATTIYICILLYIGVMIIAKSTARDKEKYKSMLMDWAVGVIILFFFPFVIKYTIALNDALVRLVWTKVVVGNDSIAGALLETDAIDLELLDVMNATNTGTDSADLMTKYRTKAIDTGNIMYGFIYLYLIFKLLNFLIIYFKREIIIIFLIVLFPFVAVTYVVDKIKDGSAQIFSGWLNEFLLNVFMQFFMGCIYVIVMFVVNALTATNGEANIVLICIGIGFITKSDSLIKVLFPKAMKGGGGGTVSPIAQTFKTATAISAIQTAGNMAGKVGHTLVNAKGNIEKRIDAFNYRNDQKVQESIQAIEEKLMTNMDIEAHGKNLSARTKDNVQSVVNRANGGLPGGAGNEGTSGNGSVGDNGTIGGAGATGGGGIDGPSGGGSLDGGASVTDDELVDRFDAVYELAELRQLGLSEPKLMAMYEEQMANLSPAEREKLEEEMMLVSLVEEVVTGKSIDGGIVTRESIDLDTSFIFEVVNSSDSKYDDFKRYLTTQRVTIGGKVPQSIRLDEYFGVPKKGGVQSYNPNFGLAYKGKRLESFQTAQMENADKILGGRVGTYTGSKIEGSFNRKTGEKFITEGRVNEGEDIGKNVVYRLTDRQRRKVINQKNNDGSSTADRLVEKYAGADATKADKEDVRKAIQNMLVLKEYKQLMQDGKIDGVDSSEMFKITSELSKLKSKNKKVQNLLAESFNENPNAVEKPFSVSDSGDRLVVNIGTTLEGLRVASAKAVLTDKKLDPNLRAQSIEEATSYLKEVKSKIEQKDPSIGDVAQAEFDRSELDMYLEDDLPGGGNSRIFLEEGLIREDKTNEQIAQERSAETVEQRKKIIYKKRIEQIVKEKSRVRVNIVSTLVDASGKAVKQVASSATRETKEFAKRVAQGRNYIEPEPRVSSASYEINLNMDSINERVLLENQDEEFRRIINRNS